LAAAGAAAGVDCVEVVLPHPVRKPNHAGTRRLTEAAPQSRRSNPEERVGWLSRVLTPMAVAGGELPGFLSLQRLDCFRRRRVVAAVCSGLWVDAADVKS